MASSDHGTVPVVIDHGTFQLKAGFTGDEAPRAVVESVVGKLKTWCMSEDLIAKCNIKDTYVGKEAQAKRGVLLLKYPIERGIITDWDSMEKLWAHTFTEELKVEPKGAKVVLSQTPCNPYQNKKKTAEIFFERFQSAEVCLANQAVLALYASGQVNGVIVDSGHGVTCAVPIHQGKPLPPKQMDLAGRDLDEATYKHLCKKGYAGRISDIQIYKEKMCYVTLEPDNVSQTGPKVDSSDWNTYELRGIELHIDPLERHRIPEALFKP